MRHVLEIDDLGADGLRTVLALSAQPPQRAPAILNGSGVALMFEKPSNRTRSSMELAVVQLGGHPVCIRTDEVGLGTRETVEDVLRTLACYHDVVAARVFDHHRIERMAACDAVPVINLLSDVAHPCQALADLLTIAQRFGIAGLPVAAGGDGPAVSKVAFVGDANNVWRSLALGCALLGIPSALAVPAPYAPDTATLERLARAGADLTVTSDPAVAVQHADVVCTDVWTSMGQEAEAAERRECFEPYRVDEALMAAASERAVFLHCLPAHRGDEVAAAVIDGPSSLVWPQAANRMHTARGLLRYLMAPERGTDDPAGS